MKHKRILLALLLSGSALAAGTDAGTNELSLTTGLDYSTGDYGTNTTSEMWYVPIAAKYETGRMTYKMTIPYLRVTNAVVSPDGDPIQGIDCSGTKTGLGDITASAGYNLLDGSANGLLLDAVAKVKLPTAESKCLGNNKTDYALQFDAARSFGAVTAFGTAGWKDMAKATLRQQIGDALLKDMSVTSPVFPSRGCQRLDPDCHNTDGGTSISESELQRLSD
ncbi:MAG: hypothetical protein AzoDbin1_03502, partial [Azoarcus sp.]|nr:hypothetical protein [Azoarcus sp.]